MIRKPKGRQHHGNLKEALVLAGLEILEEEGLDGLTLRKCAARAGVSHAAPAHHFDGLGALKSAIATRAYALFEESLLAGIKNAGESPAEKVKGLCNGYIAFSTEHNALLNLIFVSPGTYPPDPEREAAAIRARAVLTEVSKDFTAGAASVNVTEIAIWSVVHGYCKLIEIGRVVPGSGDIRDVGFDEISSILALSSGEGTPSLSDEEEAIS